MKLIARHSLKVIKVLKRKALEQSNIRLGRSIIVSKESVVLRRWDSIKG